MADVNLVLSRLDKVRRTGRDSWMACCPAHDDRSPSLSIRETDEGKILLHCFGRECAVPEILATLDLDMAALYPERPHGCTPEGQSQKPERRPFPAADVLRCVAFEALVVLASGVSMLAGWFSLATMKAQFKETIVRLAVWGVIPAGLASWLIRRGGLENA